MAFIYQEDVRDDVALRAAFNTLTGNTFGFDFEDWYVRGFWSAKYTDYRPHMLIADGEAAANISTTHFEFDVFGEKIRAIQIGTVMTDRKYRGQGLQRQLMERILSEVQACDLVYLYANDSVMSFYPRFGFVPAVEYAYSMAMPSESGAVAVPLCMDDPSDCRKFLDLMSQGDPFSAVTQEKDQGIPMFYCTGFMKEGVRYIEQLNAAAVVEEEGDELLLHDVFCPANTALTDVLQALSKPGISRVSFGFTPRETAGMQCSPVEEDGGLFVLKGSRNPFSEHQLRLPTLSHT